MDEDPGKLENLSPIELRRLLRRDQENETLIFELSKNADMDGFELALRSGMDASLRLKAARALGECYEISAVPLLARSCIEEPDPGIRDAAYTSLKHLMGEKADQVIASHRQDRHLDGPWIIGESVGYPLQPVAGDNPLPDIQEKPAGEGDIYSLFEIFQSSSDEQERAKTVRALEQIPDQRGIKALMAIAEFGQFEKDRVDAHEALRMIFGDQLQTEMQNYEEEVEVSEPQPESKRVEELKPIQPQTGETPARSKYIPDLPAMVEEKLNVIQVVLLGLLGLIVMVIIYLLTMLK